MTARLLASLVALLLPAVPALAQCPLPDALCTGDPCVTVGGSIPTPCSLDFGSRRLVILNGIQVTGGEQLTIEADSISIEGPIEGRGTNGAEMTFIADTTFYQRSLVDVSATVSPGTIHVVAGGDVTLDGKMRASGTAGVGVAGGTIVIESGGTITGPATISHDLSGARGASPGTAIYRGANGVNLLGHLIMRGGAGGFAEFTSANGPVSIGTDVRSRVTTGAGCTMILSAGTVATVARGLSCDGRTAGGTLQVSGATVVLPIHQGLKARGRGGPGGTVTVTGGTIVADEGLSADGSTAGGTVTVTGADVRLNKYVKAKGPVGGRITIVSTGDLTLQRLTDASTGGTIEAQAAGNLVVAGAVRVRSALGCIAMSAGGTLSTSTASFDQPFVSDCP